MILKKNQKVKVKDYSGYFGLLVKDEERYEDYCKRTREHFSPDYAGKSLIAVHLFPSNLIKQRPSHLMRKGGTPVSVWKENCSLIESARAGHHLTRIFE